MSSATCEPLEGNADIYGQGIRIGIYLQWISAWISLLLDPGSAQGMLDANSVFVFAVVIATIIAAQRDAPAIEMYIMLQILFGFHITILSSFGIRIWFMSPDRLQRFLDQIKKLLLEEFQKFQRHPLTQVAGVVGEGLVRAELPLTVVMDIPGTLLSFRGILYFLWHFPVELLRLLSSLKFHGLSWSGVLWRTAIMALIMGYNLADWFDENGHGVLEPPTDGCGPPLIFMFSVQHLGSVMITLGKVAAILIAVLVIPPTFTLLMLLIRIFFYALLFLYRDLIWILRGRQSGPHRLNESLSRVNEVFRRKALPFAAIRGIMQPFGLFSYTLTMTTLDFIEFISSTGPGMIHFSDVIKVGISLGMGEPVKRQQGPQSSEPWGPQQLTRAETILSLGWDVNKPGNRGLKLVCVAWNIMVVLSIAFFITSIELTIRWNNIQGVNTIDSTGQLIPFIIGCVSASQVFKKVVLLVLGKVSNISVHFTARQSNLNRTLYLP